MNTVFFGTPAVAVPFLEKLSALSNVKAVVTSPDKPAGRGYDVRPTPVKEAAARLGLPVLQPESLKGFSLHSVGPLDLGLVVAYGKLIPPEVFDFPRRGLVNVHFSLLPSYRGAGPVQWALIRGERTTGVTFFRIDAGLDTGPICLQKEVAIDDSDDAKSLMDRLVAAAVPLVADLLASETAPTPQTGAPSLAPLLTKEDGRLRWDVLTAREAAGRVRGTFLWPGAFSLYKSKTVKIRRAEAVDGGPGVPGTLSFEKGRGVLVQCRSGRLAASVLQPEGKREMPAEDFWNGFRPGPGDKFE